MSCSEQHQPMLCAPSPIAGEQWGAGQGTMEAAGGCSVAGSQGAEYKSTADISSVPFPLLWMCLAPVLQETMASSWLNVLGGDWESRDLVLLVVLVLPVTALFNNIFNRWGPSLSWIWPTTHKGDSVFAEETVCILHAGSLSLTFPEITQHTCSYAYNTKGWKKPQFFFLQGVFFTILSIPAEQLI